MGNKLRIIDYKKGFFLFYKASEYRDINAGWYMSWFQDGIHLFENNKWTGAKFFANKPKQQYGNDSRMNAEKIALLEKHSLGMI